MSVPMTRDELKALRLKLRLNPTHTPSNQQGLWMIDELLDTSKRTYDGGVRDGRNMERAALRMQLHLDPIRGEEP